MNKCKFKIGDKVKLIGHPSWHYRINQDIGKIGKIIDFRGEGALVYIEDSINNKRGSLYKRKKYSWCVEYCDGIELLDSQLLFNFMYD